MYQVSRDGQFYGPYSLEELERYLGTGNVLPGDLARSPGMTEWLPVAQVLGQMRGQVRGGQAGVPSQPGAFPGAGYVPAPVPYASPAGAQAVYPDPPNLHWVLYLVLSVVTFTLFSKVFTVVQAVWLKRVQPNSNALAFYIGYYVLYFVSLFVGFGRGVAYWMHPGMGAYGTHRFGSMFVLRTILLLVTRFVMSASLEEHFNGAEPIGLRLNPVLTFFFGGVYFQSQFNRINEARQAARYGLPRAF